MDKQDTKACCEDGYPSETYRIEALISIDERGQMVLPKDVREKAGIKPGDKLAVATLERKGKICCLYLIKAEAFSDVVRTNAGRPPEDVTI